MTKLLTIDTSSKNASISYSKDGCLIDEKNWTSKNNHSIELSENIINLTNKNNLNVNDLDYISCLLYTSPSPRDLSTSRMPSSA